MSYTFGDLDYCGECEAIVDGEVGWHGLCPYCDSEILPPPDDMVIMITNAPKEYDYGMTHEVAVFNRERVKGGCNDTPMREIWISDAYHAEIQKDRNLSGLYVTLTCKEYQQWRDDGFIVAREP